MASSVKRRNLNPAQSLPQIEARGSKLTPFEDFYHWVLTLSWPRYLFWLAFAFTLANAVFAVLYMLQPGCIAQATGFWDHFFFSVQTLGTIGYGAMAPSTRYGNVVVSAEAFLNLFATALMTGLTFARFSRPTARILFCEFAVIGPRNGKPHLMFRLANWRRNQIVDAQVRVLVLSWETSLEGERMRRGIPLKLVRDVNPMFLLSWHVLHEIDENSPFYAEDAIEKFVAEGADLFVSLTGLEETTGQTVHARYRYTFDKIVKNARFVDVISNENGVRYIDYDKYHDIERLP